MPTLAVGGVNIFDPATYSAAFQSGGILDTSNWGWENYALAGIATYLVLGRVFRGGRAVSQGVSKKTRAVGSGLKKRRKALKTVFTG
jgi:hypothetical protein